MGETEVNAARRIAEENLMSESNSRSKFRLSRFNSILVFLPFILAYMVWRWFPILSDFIIRRILNYTPNLQPTHWLWHATLGFFYAWYTFLSIGVGGAFMIASWMWNRRKKPVKKRVSPAVSFIVPAYNEEKTISKCIASLFECAANYPGYSEIIIVDDGSTDNTRLVAEATIKMNWEKWPYIKAKVIKHKANLGKVKAVKTGVGRSLGQLIALVDADTWWEQDAIRHLVDTLTMENLDAISGFIHPSDGNGDKNLFVLLQQLEYSQGLGIFRCAQSLVRGVIVLPGPISLYRAEVLKAILKEAEPKSITEDLEITLEMHRRKNRVGYTGMARSTTIAPHKLKQFWIQRKRWFLGGLHNFLSIHRRLLLSKRWIALFLWHGIIAGYGGSIVELAATLSLPLFFYFAPDRLYFIYNMVIYFPLAFLVGVIQQSVALKFAYGNHNHRNLLLYTPLYFLLRFINVLARSICLFQYMMGKRNCYWKDRRSPSPNM